MIPPPTPRDGTCGHPRAKLTAKEILKRLRRPYDLKLQVFLNRILCHHLVQLSDGYTHAEHQMNVYRDSRLVKRTDAVAKVFVNRSGCQGGLSGGDHAEARAPSRRGASPVVDS